MAAAVFRELAGARSRRVLDGADEDDPDEPALRRALVPKVRGMDG